MNISSVPFLLLTRNLQSSVTTITKNFQTAQNEAVNGRVEDISKAMDGDTGKVFKLEGLIKQAEARSLSLSAAQSEFKFVQLTLSNTRESAADLAVAVDGALGLSDDTSLATAASTARSELASLFGQYNTSFAGKQLFSGAAVDTAPLGDVETLLTDIETIIAGAADANAAETALDTYFAPGGTFETTIYQGSTNPGPTREVAENRRVGIEATPLDDGILNTIRGLAVVATARSSAASQDIADDILTDAVDTLNSSSQSLILQQASIGSVEEDLSLMITRNEASKLAYELSLTDLLGVDQYEAASRMSNLETQLEAAYLATSKITNLSLVNYLR